MHGQENNAVGLVAGWGEFPVTVAHSLRTAGYRVIGAGILGHADPELVSCCDEFRWFGMGRMGAQVRFFRRHGVTRATMAGKIFKTLLFQRWQWFRHRPDVTFWKHFYPVFVTRARDRRDDTLLTLVTELYAAGGIEFLPATDFAPELLVSTGILTTRRPSAGDWKDIQFGWEMAKRMGDLDIGQSVVVKNQAVLAVEAIEGTDACIGRAGQLCRQGGMTVVKVAKPNQDMRFDVPTVGCGTLESMRLANARVLAIEAGKTIVLNQAKFVELANRLGLCIVAVDAAQLAAVGGTPRAAAG